MLKLYQSNRLEILADLLAGVISVAPQAPLAAETVAVQHPGMARWLSLQLAARQGICANLHFPLPAAFIWDTFRLLLPEIPEYNRFEPAVLGWRLLERLQKLDDSPRFLLLRTYLEEGDALKNDDLARALADLFDQYLLYRPDWILAWERGESPVKGDDWQAELWRQLTRPEAGLHWVHLRQQLCQILERGGGHFNLPERVVLFGIPTLSQGYLDILNLLSRWMDVHLFLLNPCREHWTEIRSEQEQARCRAEGGGGDELYLEVGNPLLASLGRQGRDFFASILDYDPGSVELFLAPEGSSLLARVQTDILDLNDAAAAGPQELPEEDCSLQFHSCHSAMRETEVLLDQLQALFQRYPDLQPSDVLVMSPDIESYAPYIEAVFSESDIPFSVADRPQQVGNPLMAAFFELMRVGRGRFDSSSILGLLEVAAIRRRFGLVEGDLGQVARWVERSGIRWGGSALDRKERGLPETGQNTWRSGLDRLLLGYALPSGEERLFRGILPYDDVEGADALILGGLHHFTSDLFKLRHRLAGERSPESWGREFSLLIDRFFAPDEEEEGGQLQALRGYLETVLGQCRRAGFSQPVSVDLFCRRLETETNKGMGGRQFLSGGVTFCSLAPMRSLPAEVICLIGMNDGRFPRNRCSPGFDLMARRFRFGDRSRRADDRYLFLETLLSARRSLYISYRGQDIRDNGTLPPSVLVSELLDYLERSFHTDREGGVREALLVRHPLQPFSRRYYHSGSGLFSYSSAMREACAALDGENRPVPPFFSRELEEPAPEWRQVELLQLIAFFSSPTRFLLQHRLGIYLEEGEGLPETRDPFQLDYFVANALAQQLVDGELRGRSEAELYQLARAGGQLPHGRIGETLFERAHSSARTFSQDLEIQSRSPPLEPVTFQCRLGGMELLGTLSGLCREGLFGYSVHKIWVRQRLDLWIRHLALNILRPAGVEPVSRWLDEEGLHRFLPVKNAPELMEDLLDTYWQGLTRPLHFFPKSAYEYVCYLLKDADRARAMSAAADKWSGERGGSPECSDPYYRLVFSQGEPLDEEFRELAERLFQPLMEHLEG